MWNNFNIDERFTQIADRTTEFIGKWYFTAISIMLLVVWILYGIFIIGRGWFQSTEWGLPFNAVTSGGEWFMEGLVLAAANRVERRNRAILEKIEAQEEREAAMLAQIELALGIMASE